MNIVHTIIGNYYGFDWMAMVLQCTAIYLLGNQKRLGFITGIGGNIGWFAFGILTGSIADLISQCIVATMNIRGYFRWDNRKEGTVPSWLSPEHLKTTFPIPLL